MPSVYVLLSGFGAWNWFILGALLFTLETFLPGVHFLWFGIAAVVAKSFARIFYRASINQGLLLVECPEAVDAFSEGDEVTLDASAGTIRVGETEYSFPGLPPEILSIRDAGGLLPWTRQRLAAEGDAS